MRYHDRVREWTAERGEEIPVVTRLNRHDWIGTGADGRPAGAAWHPAEFIGAGIGYIGEIARERFQYQGLIAPFIHLFLWQAREPQEMVLPDAPDLDMSSLLDTPKHLPPFKILYDTMEEARLRLASTVVLIRSKPFLVELVGGNDKKVMLLLADSAGKHHKIPLADIPDLRSAQPRYITHDNHAYYLCRTPARVYQQGMNGHNTYGKLCGSTSMSNLERRTLLNALEDKKTLSWNETLDSLIRDGHFRDVRLSSEVSVYRHKARVIAEYKGRDLGHIKDDRVIYNFQDDHGCPWIDNALRMVKLEGYAHVG